MGACLAAGQSEDVVHIGVLAKRGDEHTITRWQPTADYLSREIPGYRFSVVPLGFDEIEKVVATAGVEFVLANSAIYVDLEMRYGVGRIATLRNRNGDRGYTMFGGVVFTRAGRDDISTLDDLAGKRFAAVKENSLGGYLMAWRELAERDINPPRDTTLSFSGTHDAVVYSVLRGLADAGTVRTDTLERMSSEGKIDMAGIKLINPRQHAGFQYLSSTRLYPEWPMAKLQHTPEVLSHRVAAALLRMEPDSGAAKAGQVAGWTVPRNYQPVHELMRELHVGPYAELGKISLEDFLRHYWHWLLLTLLALLLLSSATAYVTRLNIRLRQTENELTDARDHLAEKVQERTAELEASHHRLERISRDWNDAFDAISDPIFIHDAQMRIVQANPAYCERAGHPIEQMLGRPYYQFFPRMDKPLPACNTFPEVLSEEGDELQLESGEVFLSRSFGIHRGGRPIIHALHILEDVTAVRRAEARRRTLSRAVEQAGEGVLILDRDKQPVYCNPGLSQLLGRERDDEFCIAQLTSIEKLVVAHFAESLLQLFEDAGKGTGSASAEMALATASGVKRPVFVTVGCIRDESGGTDGYVLSVLDLSEVKQAEQALTYRLGFESVIAGIASMLVNVAPDKIDAQINSALQRLGEFASADRAYLFEYDPQDDSISNTHEWCAPGTQPQLDSLQQLPLSSLPWLREKLIAGEVVQVHDVEALPEEAGAERTEFQREAIRSLLNVPLSYGEAFAGFVGFDNVRQRRDWAEEDIRLLRIAGEIVINTIARVQALHNVQRSEASLAAAQQIAHLGNWDWNILTGELIWSDEIYRIFGLTPQQFGATYEAFLDSVHPEDRDHVVRAVNMAVAGEKDYELDHRIFRPDGSERIVHEIGDVRFDKAGEPQRMIGTVQDVTELRQAEKETRRLNRALRTLSLCNTTLVHATEEQTLMADICHILVDHGGYRFAWVGYAVQDERKTIQPVAHAGYEHGFLDALNVTWGDDEVGASPAGHAIRRGETFIARDIGAAQQSFGPWREAALANGYVSVIALPLVSQGETFGAVTIDSDEVDAFDEAELQLLEEMAGDLAFGIRTLRAREERDRAEAALKETEERYEELYENAPNAYLSVSAADGRLLQFNQALCDILGYTRETLAGMSVFQLYADTDEGQAKAKQIFAEFKHGHGVRDVELQMRHADGHTVWVSVSIDPVRDEQGEVVESRSMILDISARKRAEEERGHFAEQLQRSLLQAIRAIALTIEKRDPYTAGHQERVAELAVMLGGEMGLDEQDLEGLRLGALLHDIGKISVPAEILNRPGKLEPEMFSIIKTHPRSGYEIIRGIDFPWPLAEMVFQHHERLDGSGYPQGLEGDAILPEARILAVADVVEAMASHRPYRASLGVEIALEEIERGRGSLYDAAVVDACLKLFRERSDMEAWLQSESGR
jgi:PAS domain S-box-containing protein/putative nucleotidyltransferase with HDIG domain